jgi:hypothetical protein
MQLSDLVTSPIRPRLEQGHAFQSRYPAHQSHLSLHAEGWFLSLAGIVVEDDEPHRMLKAIKVKRLWAPLDQGWGLKA